MRAARTEILLQTYVLKPGRTLDALVEVLGSAVDGGVDACILLDPIGSQDASEKDLDRLRCAGVEVHEFMTPNPLKGRFQINFRNHRKVLVVDREVAFTGGRNWSDEYFPDFSGADAYRDTTFRVEGPLVQQLERLFREDLAIARDDLAGVTELRSGEGLEGGVVARAMPSGPDEPVDDPVDVLAVAFRAARESILIVTPYFVPGGTLHRCLRVAALSGVRVEILLPRSSGKRSIDLSARYHMRGLLDAGARIHLHDGPLLHAKYLVIDDAWCLVGSSNLDHRSMRLNHELDLEVHAPELAASLRARYLAELGRAQVVDRTEFEKRGILARLKENAAMLFEPLL